MGGLVRVGFGFHRGSHGWGRIGLKGGRGRRSEEVEEEDR